MKCSTIKVLVSLFLTLATLTGKAQLCYNSFWWTYNSQPDTINYNDSITYRLALKLYRTYNCNQSYFSDNLLFRGRADKYLHSSVVCPSGYNTIISSYSLLHTWNTFNDNPLTINEGDTSAIFEFKIPLNQTILNRFRCQNTIIPFKTDTSFLMAGNYTITSFLSDYGNYNFGSTDTPVYNIYINNPLCKPYFEITPTSTQGVYSGYNLSTGNSLEYLWDFGDGDTSNLPCPSHNYSTPGKYYVCLMVTNTVSRCMDQYCDSSFIVAKTAGGPMSQLNILAPTGIAETKSLESAISLFPNPATNQLTINANGTNLEGVRIFNLTSQLVLETKLLTNTIDISHLTTGIYFAEIKTKAGSVMKRWVKM